MTDESPIASRARPAAGHFALLALLVAGTIVMRWMLLSTFGSDAPFWDQWDSEIAALYKPFVEGTFSFAQFFAPHNEHRIAFSRAFNLLLFVANDNQFDNLVETYANSVIYTGVLVLATWPVLSRLSGAPLLLGWLAVAAAGIAPYGAENLLTGFQNAFYFMNACAVGALLAIAFGRGIAAFATALALAAAALFTLASGLLVAPAVALVACLRWHNGSLSNRAALAVVTVATAIAAAGWALLPPTAHHATLGANGVADFARALVLVLSWPLPSHPVAALALWWPAGVLLWRLLRRAAPEPAGIDLYLLGIAAWVFLQAAAIAHSRGHEMLLVNSRYTDTLVLAPLANLALAVRRLPFHAAPLKQRVTAVLAGVTALGCLLGFGLVTAQWSAYLVFSANDAEKSRVNLRAFLADGAQALDGKPAREISYPLAARLAKLLDDATIRNLLPASVRPPIRTGISGCPGFEPFVALPTARAMPHALGSLRAGVGNAAVGDCRSGPFRSRYPYLAFRVAGFPGLPGLTLALSTQGGPPVPLSISNPPGEAWTQATIANPGGVLRWIATDANPDAWFAFTPPAEMGRLSGLRARLDRWLDAAPPWLWQ